MLLYLTGLLEALALFIRRGNQLLYKYIVNNDIKVTILGYGKQ
ncbi:hypothetical protein [Melissococcus plutonius]|uniref:Uncharacterized protein n=2 Tax=Melissococcus plutonius TaxID=33970 RepID=F3Y889_MELPT|nr:hypothetical protein [Melissococcus plutonius]BAL61504.1 hypothetical protein MPD5_0198 [Melissococcus plutonius DAT561]AKQ32789.1 hypothetical protein MEPL_c001950 [Melissococcus plutonius S1]KMT25846.1 hypothetical protein MEPL2_1c01960 [Melissococcus plutonius]KMT27191.1 hypothetical protein MEPL3_1c02230 [Melissococcus plutonius]KMT28292.1 hypothetical protein MEPL1_2c01260 [Melissococcus plutonius]